MKAGDYVTEKELEEAGWKYEMSIISGVYAYEKDGVVLFWERSTTKIIFTMYADE